MRMPVVRLSVALVLALAVPARAEWIGVQLDGGAFGHLNNSGDRCAPTSAVNGFVLLENLYGDVYGGALVPGGDLAAARNALYQAPYMMSNPTAQNMWEGLVRWMETAAPGKTAYAGMSEYASPGWHYGSALESAPPTWSFLYEQIARGRATEIALYGDMIAHAVTLTGVKLDDANGNLQWDSGETAKILYIDPNDPLPITESTLSQDTWFPWYLKFNWSNGGAFYPPYEVTIGAAYAGSAVPEPSTLTACAQILLIAAWIGLGRRARRRPRSL